jgi:hypothetical protein
VLIGLVILYNAAVVALVTDTDIRYIDVMMPLSIALAGLSFGSFIGARKRPDDLQRHPSTSHAKPNKVLIPA